MPPKNYKCSRVYQVVFLGTYTSINAWCNIPIEWSLKLRTEDVNPHGKDSIAESNAEIHVQKFAWNWHWPTCWQSLALFYRSSIIYDFTTYKLNEWKTCISSKHSNTTKCRIITPSILVDFQCGKYWPINELAHHSIFIWKKQEENILQIYSGTAVNNLIKSKFSCEEYRGYQKWLHVDPWYVV